MHTETKIVETLKAQGITIPDVTPELIDSLIKVENYFTAAEGVIGAAVRRDMIIDATPKGAGGEFQESCDVSRSDVAQITEDIPAPFQHVTICALILSNGTKVVGVNYGPIVGGDFDAQKGRDMARADAVRQIYPMVGFLLRDQVLAIVDAVNGDE